MRMHAQTAMFENGLVFLPRTASWLPDFIHELTGFPGTRHDDQVDFTTQFLDYIRGDHSLEVWIKSGTDVLISMLRRRPLHRRGRRGAGLIGGGVIIC